MWVSLLHLAAAITLTLQGASAQSAEAVHSNELPITMADDFGFSPVPAANSYRYDSRTGLKAGNRVTTRILRGNHHWSNRSWFLKPHIADDVGVMDIFERPLVYPSAEWGTHRSSGTTLELPPTVPSRLQNNSAMGWKTHLGLAPPEISTKFGVPSSVAQRGIMFGANYHF
jgi:hypothetical protein